MALAAVVALLQTIIVPGDQAAELNRVRKALSQKPAVAVALPRQPVNTPVFRIVVRARKPDPTVWDNWTTVPSYLRPSMSITHYEFFELVSGEPFHPNAVATGVPLVPLIDAIIREIRKAHRRAQEESARKEVREALEELERLRRLAADPRHDRSP